MKKIQLTHRLFQIASYVESGEIVADIGSDHGYIPIYLVLEGICNKVYAMDINAGPVESAKKNKKNYKVENQVIVIQSNGLTCLEKDVDTVIIAGMGGHLMKDILEKDAFKLKDVSKLILSPHNDVDVVRKTVHKVGYKIEVEDFINDDHKYYNILVCKKGKEIYEKEMDYVYGKQLIQNKNKVYKQFLVSQKENYNSIIDKLEYNKSPGAESKKGEIVKIIIQIEEVIKWLQQ